MTKSGVCVRWGAALALCLSAAACDRHQTASAGGELLVLPNRIHFHRVAMYAGADSQLTLRNIGRGELVVAKAAIENGDGHTYAVEFAKPGRQVLGPDAVKKLQVKFRPLAEGAHAATLVLQTDNPSDPPIRIPLDGVGVDAHAIIEPRELDFGRIEAQSKKTLQLSYRNNSDLPIQVFSTVVGGDKDEFAAPGLSLAPYEKRSVDVTFAPVRVGVKDAGLQVEPCQGCPAQPVGIKAEALDRAIVAEPWELDFGQVPVDATAHLQAHLHNISTEPMTLTGMQLPPGSDESFHMAGGPAFPLVLAPDQVVSFDLSYTPSHMGAAASQAEYGVASVRNPKTIVMLRGFGGAPEVCVSPWTYDFGDIPLGGKVSTLVTVQNCGSANANPLVISDVTFGGDGVAGEDEFGFVAAARPITLAAGQAVTIKVSFEPMRIGAAGGYLHLTTSSFGAEHLRVGFTATSTIATLCSLVVTPSKVDFGTVQPGLGAVLGVKVQNVSSHLCAVKNILLRDDGGGVFGMPGGALDGFLVWPGDFFSFMVSFKAPKTGSGQYNGTLQIESADPAHPLFLVPLVANDQQSCLVANPPYVDFGLMRSDCPASPRTVRFSNECTSPLSVDRVWIGPGTTDTVFSLDGVVPGAPLTLAPGESYTATVSYSGQPTGMNLSPLFSDATGLGAPYLVPLLGESTSHTDRTDDFVQQAAGRVDVLFVVDNSASMVEEQARLAAAIPSFVSAALSKGIDLHVAVTTTGIDPVPGGTCPGGVQGGEAGRIFPADNSRMRIMTNATPDLAADLQQNVQVGLCAEVEEGLEAMRRALSTPLVDHADAPLTPLANDGNLGFLRQDAGLAVVVVSDEDDHSPGTVTDYVQFLQSVKGMGQPQRSVFYAIAPTTQVCSTLGGTGVRYDEMAAATGGQSLDVCSADFSPLLEAVAARSFGPQSRFPLAARADPATITVTIDGIPASGWTYDAASNQIVFATAPAAGAQISVHYQISC